MTPWCYHRYNHTSNALNIYSVNSRKSALAQHILHMVLHRRRISNPKTTFTQNIMHLSWIFASNVRNSLSMIVDGSFFVMNRLITSMKYKERSIFIKVHKRLEMTKAMSCYHNLFTTFFWPEITWAYGGSLYNLRKNISTFNLIWHYLWKVRTRYSEPDYWIWKDLGLEPIIPMDYCLEYQILPAKLYYKQC